MGISTVEDSERRVLVATVVGEVTVGEIQHFIRTSRTGEQRAWPLLFDMTQATTAIESTHVRGLADQVGSTVRQEGPRAPVALVAPSDILYGLARMYQTLCQHQGVDVIGVFRTRAEADAWLGEQSAT